MTKSCLLFALELTVDPLHALHFGSFLRRNILTLRDLEGGSDEKLILFKMDSSERHKSFKKWQGLHQKKLKQS